MSSSIGKIDTSDETITPLVFGGDRKTLPSPAAAVFTLKPSSTSSLIQPTHTKMGPSLTMAPDLGVFSTINKDVASLHVINKDDVGEAAVDFGTSTYISDEIEKSPTYTICEVPQDIELLLEITKLGLDVCNPFPGFKEVHAMVSNGTPVPFPFSIMKTQQDVDIITGYIRRGFFPDVRNQNLMKYKSWKFTPLYKTSSLGKTLTWLVLYNTETCMLNMVHGHVGGKIQINEAEVKQNKTSRSIYEQSVIAARQRYTLKCRKEFYMPPGEAVPFYNKPMLANVFKYNQPKGNTKLTFPVLIQPKLDGARCLSRMNNGKMIYRSRGNKEWHHLNEELDPEISEFILYIPIKCELDGEAYIHGAQFSKFSSILKNMKVKDPRINELQYCIYDFNTPDPIAAEDRQLMLSNAYKAYIADGNKATRFCIVPSIEISPAHGIQGIIHIHRQYTASGYEGTMIRKISKTADGTAPTQQRIKESLYKSNRSNNLLKLKDINDAEGLIVAVNDGQGTEKGKATVVIRCVHKNLQGVDISTDVNMRPACTFEERALWFNNPELILGKLATYEFQEITEYGVPRNPVMKSLRDYE
jgi:ATP-dependent DNA ligase